jgi:hypothetical protein
MSEWDDSNHWLQLIFLLLHVPASGTLNYIPVGASRQLATDDLARTLRNT